MKSISYWIQDVAKQKKFPSSTEFEEFVMFHHFQGLSAQQIFDIFKSKRQPLANNEAKVNLIKVVEHAQKK